MRAQARLPLLRIPPFPGAKLSRFSELDGESPVSSDLIAELRRLRVGGTYWAAQPSLPADCLLVRSPAALPAAEKLAESRPIVLWLAEGVIPHGPHTLGK